MVSNFSAAGRGVRQSVPVREAVGARHGSPAPSGAAGAAPFHVTAITTFEVSGQRISTDDR
jgi:hypothetical protein